MSPIPWSRKFRSTCLTILLAGSFPLVMGACTTKPQVLQTTTQPSANLMQPAQRPYLIENPDKVPPEEAVKVSILNLGILKDVANRLHLLQEWAKKQVNVP